jgi:hypothetical protein
MYEELNSHYGRFCQGSNGISLWHQTALDPATTPRGWDAAQLPTTARLLNGGLANFKKQHLRAEWVGQ